MEQNVDWIFVFAGYVAELVANWFIGSEIPLSILKKLLIQHDKQRKKKQQDEMEVIEAKEETEILLDEVPCEEESELDNYHEISGMYVVG